MLKKAPNRSKTPITQLTVIINIERYIEKSHKYLKIASNIKYYKEV